jgi:hypothetical protein
MNNNDQGEKPKSLIKTATKGVGKIFGFILILAFVKMVIVNFVIGFVRGHYSRSDKITIEELRVASSEYNKNLPTILNKDVTLSSTFVEEPRKIVFTYALGRNLDEIDKDLFSANLKVNVLNSVCSQKPISDFLTKGATQGYIYSSKDGYEVATFEIQLNDCKPAK